MPLNFQSLYFSSEGNYIVGKTRRIFEKNAGMLLKKNVSSCFEGHVPCMLILKANYYVFFSLSLEERCILLVTSLLVVGYRIYRVSKNRMGDEAFHAILKVL